MKNSLKSHLLLVEILIMTLFFAISAAVCLRIFAASFQMSASSHDLNEATTHVQSVASCYNVAGGDLPDTARYLSATVTENKILLLYDKNWNATQADDAVFVLTLEQIDGQATITVDKILSAEPIFSITVMAIDR